MITAPEIETYCKTHTQPESPVLQAIREYTEAHVHGAHMLSGILVGRTLQLLLKLMQAKRVLDLGTFTGYSALSMAEVLPEGAIVTTCDQSAEILKLAQDFFSKSIHGHKIKVFEGKVIDCLQGITEPIDFVFMDADKTEILSYIEILYPKLSPGGLIVVDNALHIHRGTVLEGGDKNLKALSLLNETMVKDSRFMNVLLPVRDGLNIMCKT